MSYKNIFAIFIIFGFSTVSLYSQNKIINGRVISDFLETLSSVSIIINDSIKIGTTDSEGNFRIKIPVSINEITFKSVGLETTTIKLIKDCDEVEIVMFLRGTYDFVNPKKIDKIRKMKFKDLQKLHKKASKEAIFKTDKPCYVREFLYYHTK